MMRCGEGASKGSLGKTHVASTLEAQPKRKLQGTHFGSAFEAGDFAIVAALAVDARICAVVSAERVHRVIEYVKCVHTKLSFDPLSDGDIFCNRQVRIEPSRPTERVVTDVAQVPKSGVCKRTGQRRQRSEECHRASGGIERAHSRVEGT